MIPIVANIIAKAVGEVTGAVGKTLDATLTSDDEKLTAKNQLAEIVEKSLTEAISFQRDVLVAEIQGNALQRNWRPIVMLSFAFIVVYHYFIAPLFHLQDIELPEKFWGLLELGMGGYVIGRSVEKVADTLTKNIDLPFLKKRDRDENIK
ncbi:MAG: hypothetical protein A3F72_15260 [Bacteroidetes bacterium RIFCSPLOWO2_12_FULL_35_15]|nr:MAG: hypothetical protein A3F72_15260 [Bacteroidetes bacterium RIFCSPLOWO2_12_FULL_35_15]